MVKKLGLHKAPNAIYRISINPATGKRMCRYVKGATKAGMKRIAKKKTTKKGGSLKGLMKKVNRAVPRSVKRAGVNLAVGAINSQAKKYVPKQYHGYVNKGTKLARSSIAKKTGYGLHRNLTPEEQILANQATEMARQKINRIGSGFRMTIPR